MTIIDELKQIANVCITSAEFTNRAKTYLAKSKNIKQRIMSDSELRDIYREVEYDREVDKAWEKYDNTIKPILQKRPECKHIYYEAWIDLEDSWIYKWMNVFRYMNDNEIVEVCVKFLNEQERFYNSKDYIDMLNSLKPCKIN